MININDLSINISFVYIYLFAIFIKSLLSKKNYRNLQIIYNL